MHRTTAAHSVLCGACLQRAAAPLAVKGRKSIFTVNSTADTEVLATFSSDGSPAATRRKVGEGYAIYVRMNQPQRCLIRAALLALASLLPLASVLYGFTQELRLT